MVNISHMSNVGLNEIIIIIFFLIQYGTWTCSNNPPLEFKKVNLEVTSNVSKIVHKQRCLQLEPLHSK